MVRKREGKRPLGRYKHKWEHNIKLHAGPSGRAFKGVDLQPFACWDRGFESRRGHERLSVVSVVCCQVEVSATSWPLVEGSPTDCGASLCVRSKPHE